MFWRVIVEREGLGQETLFEFVYIPQFGKTMSPGALSTTRHTESGVEWRNLKLPLYLAATLLLSTAGIVVVARRVMS